MEDAGSRGIAIAVGIQSWIREAFEIHLLLENDEKVLIWSGLKRGPPRREKFPDADTLLQAAQKALL
jgi:hypothetical protein